MDGNGFAEYFENLDQANCATQDAFQNWFDTNETDLREEYENHLYKLSGEDGEPHLYDEDEFVKWAQEKWEKSK